MARYPLLWLLAILGSLPVCSTGVAQWKTDTVDKICHYLNADGLCMGSYRQRQDEEVYGTASRYKDLGSEPLPNNIVYYVEGEEKEVKELKLVLNVNIATSAKAAQKDFARIAGTLIQRSSGQPTPGKVLTSIEAGQEGKWQCGECAVRLTRETWDTGNGFEPR